MENLAIRDPPRNPLGPVPSTRRIGTMITRSARRSARPFLPIRIYRADQAEIDTHAPPL